MKQSFSFSLIVPALAVLLVSCNEATEPTTECSLENSFRLQTGNWWVYESYDIDNKGAKIPGTDRLDSVVVEDLGSVFGKDAYFIVTYTTNDAGVAYAVDSMWMAVDNGQAYIRSVDFEPEISCCCVPDMWTQIADCEREQWATSDTLHETMPSRIQQPDGQDTIITSTVRNDIWYRGRRGADEQRNVGGRTVAVREYRIDSGYDSIIIEPEGMSFFHGTGVLMTTRATQYWLAENIGIVAKRRSSYRVTDGVNELEWKPGVQQTLLRWSGQ